MTQHLSLRKKTLVALAGASLATALFCSAGTTAFATPVEKTPAAPTAQQQAAPKAHKNLGKPATTTTKATPQAAKRDASATKTKDKIDAARGDFDAKLAAKNEAQKDLAAEKKKSASLFKESQKATAQATAKRDAAKKTEQDAKKDLDKYDTYHRFVNDQVAAATQKRDRAQAKQDEIQNAPNVFPGIDNLTIEQRTELIEVALLEKINNYRKTAGLYENYYEGGYYRDKAREWSKHMNDVNRLYHGNDIPGWTAENCAAYWPEYRNPYDTAQRLFDMWKHSPGHNDNFLWDKPNVHTVGVYLDGYKVWATYRAGTASTWDKEKPVVLSSSKDITGIDATVGSNYDPYDDASMDPSKSGNRHMDTVFYERIPDTPATEIPLDYTGYTREDRKNAARALEKATADLERFRGKLNVAAAAQKKAATSYRAAQTAATSAANEVASIKARYNDRLRNQKKAVETAQARFDTAYDQAKSAMEIHNDLLAGYKVSALELPNGKPENPFLFSAKHSGYGTVSLAWRGSVGASSYAVYRKVGNGQLVRIGTTEDTSFVDNEADKKKANFYFVAAVHAENDGDNPTETASSLSNYLYALANRPVPVTDVTSRNASNGTVEVSWKPTNDNMAHHVFRSTGSGAYQYVGTVSSGKNSFVDRAPDLGTTNSYKIMAFTKDDAGKTASSPLSEAACAYGNLGTPASLKAKTARTGIVLYWQPARGADRYLIYRLVNGERKLAGWTNANKPPIFVDTHAPKGSVVTYQLYALGTHHDTTLVSPRPCTLTFKIG